MAGAGIAIHEAPPLAAPLRFLLSAPVFGFLAGALLLWAGPAAFSSRWTPALLGATHLLTLGVMAMVMLGALLQLMPVVAGAPLPRPALLAGLTHPALAAGTLLLAGGLWLGVAAAVRAAVPLLALGFGAFVALALRALWRAPSRDAVGRSIGAALLALAVTVALGAGLATLFGWGAAIPAARLVGLHVGWGLVGWTVVLMAAVAQQVVPMFQLTPLYPRLLAARFAPTMLALLAAWSAAEWLGASALSALLGAAIAGLTVIFGLWTLALQLRSRRPAPDATFLAWRAGMLFLVLAAVAGSIGAALGGEPAAYAILTGVAAIAGFALSIISGMLYKIVPFLVWLHLQKTVGGRVPNIRQILPDAPARAHLHLHLLSVALLCAAAVWPAWFLYPAATALCASHALLGWILVRASRWARWTG